jgi:hypothetical protein
MHRSNSYDNRGQFSNARYSAEANPMPASKRKQYHRQYWRMIDEEQPTELPSINVGTTGPFYFRKRPFKSKENETDKSIKRRK